MSRKYVNFDVEDNIGKYFKDVRKSTILTPSEEISLAERIKEGDDKAVDLLVNANLKFVWSRIRTHKTRYSS